ncbi:LysM peptidoglycan-binding domain-containing protein [Sanguibacter antarcticus]|uniref:LysM domain-containing protein n=1 Tax=Sanguibacter antarcticus TaxID=372484 RepID=A0A2A9E552_9MICO|nr:LysM peptidoglycan-binding domain-containing protein [Sanguibacter antarcticus]PFG33485.1 LysM domain-containing protein [Sanguibacter antarcticus]
MAHVVALSSGAAHIRSGVEDWLGIADLEITRRGRLVVWTIGVALMLVVLLMGGRAVAGSPDSATHVMPHTVSQGETLWAIASTVAHPGEDLRDVVSLIIEVNGRSSADLQAGEQILLPLR